MIERNIRLESVLCVGRSCLWLVCCIMCVFVFFKEGSTKQSNRARARVNLANNDAPPRRKRGSFAESCLAESLRKALDISSHGLLAHADRKRNT